MTNNDTNDTNGNCWMKENIFVALFGTKYINEYDWLNKKIKVSFSWNKKQWCQYYDLWGGQKNYDHFLTCSNATT